MINLFTKIKPSDVVLGKQAKRYVLEFFFFVGIMICTEVQSTIFLIYMCFRINKISISENKTKHLPSHIKIQSS